VLTMGTALVFFGVWGLFAVVMRVQLAQPDQLLVGGHLYSELFTMHGSGMIYTVITPMALGAGVYMIPLQVGAPAIAAPRVTLFGYWLYVAGIAAFLCTFLTGQGASTGWYAYMPLSSSNYTPGAGQSLWIVGVWLTTLAMILMAATVLWTALRLRAPGMTLLRMPIFTWSMIVTTMMTVASFPALLAAMSFMAAGRMDPPIFQWNVYNILYQNLFWFYGHPVVYVMFFPFVGMVIESLATFSGRRYTAYKPTVGSLMLFAAFSMSVWGHHLMVSGQSPNDYFSFTSLFLSIPAGAEYFGMLTTIVGGRIVYTTSMLFALAFIPQFLVGGLSGIMLGTSVIDYHLNGSFFVVAHFHYTLFAGSVFGFFAGLYMWWPKVTGFMLDERLGRTHFWIMAIGTNVTFLPMFISGFMGMPRRVATYPALLGVGTLNLVSSIGSGILLISFIVFVVNVVLSIKRRIPSLPDPWGGQTLEWATTSPPPRYNFVALPPIKSHAPLWDLRKEAGELEEIWEKPESQVRQELATSRTAAAEGRSGEPV
jgi:cytochrome c oxidase subunit 1